MIETGGWDTHSGQNAPPGRQLQGLDALIGALRDGLGAAWAQTVVLVATEFGRTAAANGTGGTDHGTGAAAMLVGGAVQGGRVVADWPGLAPANLLEGRDLRPTLALDALIAADLRGDVRARPGAHGARAVPGRGAEHDPAETAARLTHDASRLDQTTLDAPPRRSSCCSRSRFCSLAGPTHCAIACLCSTVSKVCSQVTSVCPPCSTSPMARTK